MAFQDDYPELAAMFQALQDGIADIHYAGEPPDRECWEAGFKLHDGNWYLEDVAAGLRMVADAIDPPITPEEEAWIAENMGGFDEKLVAALVETKARIEAQAQLKLDIAEMLARPKKNLLCVICASTSHDRQGHFIGQSAQSVNCMVCGETKHIEMDCPYLHGRARHVCDDTCPAKYPSPCLCGNQPTHERDVCPFEAPEVEPSEFQIYIDAQGNEHGEF